MRDALSTILIEVLFFSLAYAAKVNFDKNNEGMLPGRWLKKGKGKKKSVKLKISTQAPITSVKKTSQPIKVSMKPIKAPIQAPIQAKCSTYSLGIVSLWDTTDECWDNCLNKTAYTYMFSNICQDGTKMQMCNKDFMKVSFYENLNCTGAEYVSSITKDLQCASYYDDDSPATYINWKCVHTI
jgi:hypothetical protein